MTTPKYNIAIEISLSELRYLISVHAGRIDRALGIKDDQDYMQQSAERMSILLGILKKQGKQ